jgi:hypothetical protein
MSTYRLRILRFDADDFGRPGDGGGGAKPNPGGNGVLEEDLFSGGTRFERARKEDLLFGGDTLRSIAEADRNGGGARPEDEDDIGLLRPGEAV